MIKITAMTFLQEYLLVLMDNDDRINQLINKMIRNMRSWLIQNSFRYAADFEGLYLWWWSSYKMGYCNWSKRAQTVLACLQLCFFFLCFKLIWWSVYILYRSPVDLLVNAWPLRLTLSFATHFYSDYTIYWQATHFTVAISF